MLGHSHHKVRSMSPANGCPPGNCRGGKHFISQLCEHRGGKTMYVRSRRKATNLQHERVMLWAPSQAEMLTKCCF